MEKSANAIDKLYVDGAFEKQKDSITSTRLYSRALESAEKLIGLLPKEVRKDTLAMVEKKALEEGHIKYKEGMFTDRNKLTKRDTPDTGRTAAKGGIKR